MISPDLIKARREYLRWLVLQTLDKGRPRPVHEQMILVVARAIYPDVMPEEIRRKLDYLEKRELVRIIKDPSGPWLAELTRHGVDIVDYTVPVDAGIARPEKYW
jgi:Fe2+ or Zn2+ uptake regulation protein